DHLARRQIVVTVDRLFVGVGAVIGIVAVGRIPIVVVPIIITAAEKNDPVVAAPPPTAVVAFPIKTAARLFEREGAGGVIILPVAVRVRAVLPIAVAHRGVRVRLEVWVRRLIRDDVCVGPVPIPGPILIGQSRVGIERGVLVRRRKGARPVLNIWRVGPWSVRPSGHVRPVLQNGVGSRVQLLLNARRIAARHGVYLPLRSLLHARRILDAFGRLGLIFVLAENRRGGDCQSSDRK